MRDGVVKTLSAYPNITEWEIQTVLDFISYESKYGRNCEIEADDQIINAIEKYKSNIKHMQNSVIVVCHVTFGNEYVGQSTLAY